MMSSSPPFSESIYDALAQGVRTWIDIRNWTDFTEIQARAIPEILAGRGALLVSPTASGKTEAALLPILSRIVEDRLPPIALLYVAPLRALINDQSRRIAKVIEECSLRYAWWHGDLSQRERRKIVARPPHALLTTPESIEVLLSGDSYGHGAILGNVQYILIDEIHAFAIADRGHQLMSLLARLEEGKKAVPMRVALSATVGSPEAVISWMRSARPDAPPIALIRETGSRGRRLAVGLIPLAAEKGEERVAIAAKNAGKTADVLAKHAAGERLAIFGTSRQSVEQLTVALRERGVDAYIHHGSLDVSVRRQTEAKFREPGPKVIVATSTLELGIDIGDLELVIQVGTVPSVTALLQRAGRSGRRSGMKSTAILYARSVDELPSLLAAGELALEEVVEPLAPSRAAVHIAFHQAISLIREQDAVTQTELRQILSCAGCFAEISTGEWLDLLEELVTYGYLELERDRLRLGPETLRQFSRANYYDFYSVFATEDAWTVRYGSETIGTLDLHFPVTEGREQFFVLGGRRWRIASVDRVHLLVRVEPAERGPIPNWTAPGGESSYEIMQRTCNILAGKRGALESPTLTERLRPARQHAAELGILPGRVVIEEDHSGFRRAYTYFGTETNTYLATLLSSALGVSVSPDADSVVIHRSARQSTAEVGALLQQIFTQRVVRAQIEAAILAGEPNLAIGKYWPYFGPKTRRHVVQRFLFDNPQHERRFQSTSMGRSI